jgi:hypothetical protein
MQPKHVLPEEGNVTLRMKLRDVDWNRLWLLEVVILGVPTLVTVFATGGRSPVSPRGVVVLLVVLVALTVVNLFFGLLQGSEWTHRSQARTIARRS